MDHKGNALADLGGVSDTPKGPDSIVSTYKICKM